VWKLTSTDHIASAWNEAQKQYLAQADEKTVSGDGIQFKFATTDEEKIRALKAEFDELKEMEQQLSKRAQKLSDRVRLVNGGLLRRADQARTLLRTQLADVENAEIEHACFENLASLEEVALQKRMAQLASEVNAQQYAEVQLQKTYAALKQSA